MGYETGLYGEFSITPPVAAELRERINAWGKYENRNQIPEGFEYEHPFEIAHGAHYSRDGGTVTEAECDLLTTPEDVGKFYGYEEWIPYLVGLLVEAGHKVEGEITWDGEDSDDKGRFVATGAEVHTETLVSYYVPDGAPSPLRVLFDEADATVASFERLLATGHAEGDPARAVFVQRINDLAAAVAAARKVLRGEVA